VDWGDLNPISQCLNFLEGFEVFDTLSLGRTISLSSGMPQIPASITGTGTSIGFLMERHKEEMNL